MRLILLGTILSAVSVLTFWTAMKIVFELVLAVSALVGTI